MIYQPSKNLFASGHDLARALHFMLLAVALLVAPGLSLAPTQASDPLRLKEEFRLLDLTPYMRTTDDGGKVFAVQNGGTRILSLIIERPPQNDLAVAVGLVPSNHPPLRLFSSDDREFASRPGHPERLQFDVPPNAVQSFYLPAGLLAGAHGDLYLWSPAEYSAHENRRQTFRSSLMLLLSVLTVAAIATTIIRRSRRAAYAVVMGLGLTVLLGSLWMRDIVPMQFEYLMAERVNAIRFALAMGVFMTLLGHVNLIIRQILNRNYWTRVIIVSDMLLLASATAWAAQIYNPDFAGLLSVELAYTGLAATCATVLLGAIFVPDRSGNS